MEKYYFTSNLLIVAPEFAGADFKWIDTIKGASASGDTDVVNVLAFNVKSKEEIKPMLEGELKKLQDLEEPSEQDVHNMAYLESIVREMEEGCFEHEAPASLLEAIGKCARRPFYPKDVIYLSGVSGIRD